MRLPRRYIPRLLLAFVLLLFHAAAPAQAAFVLFFQPMGGWSVLCSRDEPTGIVSCTADAPPPALNNAPAVVVHVTETVSGAFSVTLEMRADVSPGAPVTVGVDGGKGVQAPLDRDYRARIDGTVAGQLVADMLSGRQLVIDARLHGDGAPIEVIISLETFSQAFAVMRTNLRSFGAIQEP